MNIERARSILGVWAPMAIGAFIMVTAINFYFTANLTTGLFIGNLESWRLLCSAGTFFVGGLLVLSTYGRYRKSKEARREAMLPPPSLPPAPRQEEPDQQRDPNRDD